MYCYMISHKVQEIATPSDRVIYNTLTLDSKIVSISEVLFCQTTPLLSDFAHLLSGISREYLK